MPDKRRHRGPHPLDAKLFAPDQIGALRGAVGDFSWLLERGYAAKSALQLVGNRFGLHERQRLAVLRSSCSESARRGRLARKVEITDWRGRTMQLDGYNLLMTIEAALGGGVMLRGRDGCLRDMAALHGNFRSVEETATAATLIGEFLHPQCGVIRAVWWLDSPVSNSGRLKGLLHGIAAERGWNWDVHLAFDADAALKKLDGYDLVVSADSVVLDNVGDWANVAAALVEAHVRDAWLVDLSEPAVNFGWRPATPASLMNNSSVNALDENGATENAGDAALDMLLDPAPASDAANEKTGATNEKPAPAPQLEAPPAIARLDAATSGLRMPSECDEPFRTVYWPLEKAEITPAEVALYLTENADALVETQSVTVFFQNATKTEDWMDDEEQANVGQFEQLVETLNGELETPRVYLIGERERTAAIIGKVMGGFAGVVTLVVET